MRNAEVTVVGQSEVVTVRISGEVDMANVVEVGQRLRDTVPNDVVGLCLDLSAVQYIDSAGIQMLFGLVRDLGACRQGLGIAAPEHSSVHKLLKITNVGEVALVHDSREGCEAALRAARGDMP